MSSLPWDDDDVLLRLFPLNETARKCCKRHNVERYVPSPSQKNVSSQENTPAPSSLSTFDGDFLELRFSDAFSGKWSIGRLESCYVVLQGPGVSSKHCDIIATEDGFYVVDQSTFGTAVAFDCNNLTFQRHGSWKIANCKGTKDWSTLAVRIGENVFSVQLRDPGFEGQTLSNNVKGFVEHAKSGLPNLSGFDLGSASTTLQPPTPYEAIDMLGAEYPTLFTSTEALMLEPIDPCEDNTKVNSGNDTNKKHVGFCYQSPRSGRYRHSSIAERHGYITPSGPLQKETSVSTQAKGPENRAPQRRICGVDGCEKSYTDRGSICRHRKVHNSQAAKIACKVPNCNFKTKRTDTLRTHYLRHVNAPDQTCNKRHVAGVSAEELKTLLGPEDTRLFQSVMDKYDSSRSEKPGTVSVGSDIDHNHMPGVKNPLSCTLDEALTFGLSDAREAFTQELAEVAQHFPATESNMEADLNHKANREYNIFDYRSSGPCQQMTSVSLQKDISTIYGHSRI